MIYLQLFLEFFKTGLFAVGGGLATLPFLANISDKYGWFTRAELANMIAVAESTPGPIGVNCATYAGFNTAGLPGAVLATFALVLPSFIVITLVARALQKYNESPLVQAGFAGLRPAVSGLIGAAGYSVLQAALFTGAPALATLSVKAVVLFALLMLLTNLKPLKKLHPVCFIALAAAAGILFQM